MNTIKKIITAISAAAFTLPVLSACEDEFEYTFIDPIEYTASAPVVEFIDIDYNTTNLDKNIKFESNEFDEFTEYYKENYLGSNIYLLEYGLKPQPWLYNANDFIIYDDGEFFIIENFAAYDEELGSKPTPPNLATGYWLSFSSIIIIKPLKNISQQNALTFEFGNNHNHYLNKYINIFVDNHCFATFYFNAEIPITQEWFENYLNENLIWGDTYENR